MHISWLTVVDNSSDSLTYIILRHWVLQLDRKEPGICLSLRLRVVYVSLAIHRP